MRVHWHIFVWAVQRRDIQGVVGQNLRIVGAATKTAVGLIPSGNTGGSNVGPFTRMPVPEDLADILEEVSKPPA